MRGSFSKPALGWIGIGAYISSCGRRCVTAVAHGHRGVHRPVRCGSPTRTRRSLPLHGRSLRHLSPIRHASHGTCGMGGRRRTPPLSAPLPRRTGVVRLGRGHDRHSPDVCDIFPAWRADVVNYSFLAFSHVVTLISLTGSAEESSQRECGPAGTCRAATHLITRRGRFNVAAIARTCAAHQQTPDAGR